MRGNLRSSAALMTSCLLAHACHDCEPSGSYALKEKLAYSSGTGCDAGAIPSEDLVRIKIVWVGRDPAHDSGYDGAFTEGDGGNIDGMSGQAGVATGSSIGLAESCNMVATCSRAGVFYWYEQYSVRLDGRDGPGVSGRSGTVGGPSVPCQYSYSITP